MVELARQRGPVAGGGVVTGPDEHTCLVTGETGFVGRHALAHWPWAQGLGQTPVGPVNLMDRSAVHHAVANLAPRWVLHLAGISFVPDAVKNPRLAYEVNFLGTLHLLEALAAAGFKGRFLFVSSGDAYGLVAPQDLPIRETLPLRPRNPYAVSKAAAEALCYQWSQTGPFEVMVARPFNHIGPGQSPQFALSDFARQIAEIAAGKRPPVLTVGNIDVTRDFSDVRDVLAAYEAILQHGNNGHTYNVCSGTERDLRAVLERLLDLSGVKAEIVTDPARWRPAEQTRVCASHDKLTEQTGWQPVHPFDETLLSLYRFWENEIGS